MFSNTPDWSRWSDILAIAGLILGILVALVTILGWICSRKAEKHKDEALEKYKLESRQSIAEADVKAAEANKNAAIANEAAGNANERAAKLEMDAAVARLELERLQQKLAWRKITASQKESFITFTASIPKQRITMSYLSGNEEVLAFASQLADLLREAGYESPKSVYDMIAVWTVSVGSNIIGLAIYIKNQENQAAGALQKALQQIGIPAPGKIKQDQQDDIIHIQVGAKP